MKKISEKVKLLLKIDSGEEDLIGATEVFPSGIDLNFQLWKTKNEDERLKKSKKVEEGEVEAGVYELSEGGNFLQIFSSLSIDFDKSCLTQGQIKEFCLNHNYWLKKGGMSTFFPFKLNGDKYVAVVYIDSLFKAGVDIFPLGFDYTWSKEARHHLVVIENNS